MGIDPAVLDSLRALLLGLAFSGLIATAWDCAAARPLAPAPPGGRGLVLLAPILLAAAPFLILRRALSPRRFERRRAGPVMAATVLAGLWALASGEVLLGLAHRIAA